MIDIEAIKKRCEDYQQSLDDALDAEKPLPPRKAISLVSDFCGFAVDDAIPALIDEIERLRDALEEIRTRPRKRHPMAIATEALNQKEATDADTEKKPEFRPAVQCMIEMSLHLRQ